MIINSVVKNEALRNSEMIQQYEKLISELPKGSLICRKNEYFYLKYRKNGKVCDDYIGKDREKISRIKEQLEQRKHYEKMLSALKQEQKVINKILGELVRFYIMEAQTLLTNRKFERTMFIWILVWDFILQHRLNTPNGGQGLKCAEKMLI